VKQIILIVCCLILAVSPLSAENKIIDEEHRRLAEKLLNVMKTGEQMEKQMEKLSSISDDMFKEYDIDDMQLGDEYKKQQEDIWENMAEIYKWENIKNDYVTIYAEVFTKEELRELIKIFKSPAGQAYVDKTPQINKKIMMFSFSKAKDIVPDFEDSVKNARVAANDALAQSTLRTLSTAAETYGVYSNGRYPQTMSQLMESKPPFINTNYCDQSSSGYKFTCEMTDHSYLFTAIPDQLGETGTTTYTIRTGGILEP